jgi:hypothetical protein
LSLANLVFTARDQHLRGAFIFEEPDELPDGTLFNAVVKGLRADHD